MPRFEKTRIHPASAVLFMFGIYALAGAAYAAWAHSDESVTIWVVVAAIAFAASVVYQRYVTIKRKRTP